MNSVEDRLSHEAVNERLPWFVNGTLPDEERGMVAEHLEQCQVCRADLRLCEEMARSVRSERAVPIPPAATADELLAGVERVSPRSLRFDWRVAAAIALVAISIAAGLSVSQQRESPNQVFTTVTQGPSVSTVEYIFEIRFAGDISEAARQSVLENLGGEAHIVDKGAATYHVTMSITPRALVELEAMAADMEARPGIHSAEVVALQVPVR